MSNVTPESLIPETALRRMAPAPGGNWVVVAQFDDHFTLAYIMDGGQESVTYDFYPCDTEEKIMNICGDAIHEYNKPIDTTGLFVYNRPIKSDFPSVTVTLRPRKEKAKENENVVQNQTAANMDNHPTQAQTTVAQQFATNNQPVAAQGMMQDATQVMPQDAALLNSVWGNGAGSMDAVVNWLATSGGMEASDGMDASNTMFDPHGMNASNTMVDPHVMDASNTMIDPHGMEASNTMFDPHGMDASNTMVAPHGMDASNGMDVPDGMAASGGMATSNNMGALNIGPNWAPMTGNTGMIGPDFSNTPHPGPVPRPMSNVPANQVYWVLY